MKDINVLICDDDTYFCKLISDYLNNEEGINVVGTISDGNDCCDNILKLSPDLLILDIIMPRVDGVEVLHKIKSLDIKPYIIIISAVSNDKVLQLTMRVGADYYFIKPFNLDSLVTMIRELCNKDKKMSYFRYNESTTFKEMNVKSLEESGNSLLVKIGMPVNLQGYKYLKTALAMVINNSSLANHLTKELYPKVALEHDSTAARVERSIRHAIELTWNKGNINEINDLFGYTINKDKGKPTNGEFISMLTDKNYITK